MTKQNLEQLLKKNEVITDFKRVQQGTDQDGYPTYEVVYINPPKNFRLVKFLDGLDCAILEDLTVITE